MVAKCSVLKVGEPCLILPDSTVATLRFLLNSLLCQGGRDLGSEEIRVLRTWAVEERFWKRREEATVQIVGRPNIEIQQIKVEELEKRERFLVEATKEREEEGEEEDVAIIWRQEEEVEEEKEEQEEKKEEEVKSKAALTPASNNGRKMLCKVCAISFQGRPYSEYQVKR